MQHLGPVGGVDAAGLRADGDQRLAGVVLAGEQRAHLELARPTSGAPRARPRPRRGWPRRPPPRPARRARPGRRAGWRRPSTRRARPGRSDSREVTFWAWSWSSHRSGARGLRLRSASSARIFGRSSTFSMLVRVASRSCTDSELSGAATSAEPTRAPGQARRNAGQSTYGARAVEVASISMPSGAPRKTPRKGSRLLALSVTVTDSASVATPTTSKSSNRVSRSAADT